jgi:hypothetical protein
MARQWLFCGNDAKSRRCTTGSASSWAEDPPPVHRSLRTAGRDHVRHLASDRRDLWFRRCAVRVGADCPRLGPLPVGRDRTDVDWPDDGRWRCRSGFLPKGVECLGHPGDDESETKSFAEAGMPQRGQS